MVFTAEGDAYAWGSNKHGQLGVGSIARTKPKEDDLRLEPVQGPMSGGRMRTEQKSTGLYGGSQRVFGTAT